MSLCVTRAALEALLFEDAPLGDLTTEILGLERRKGVMFVSARGPMVVALVKEAACLLELAGARVDVHAADGATLAPHAQILSARASADALLRGWKPAQALLEIWSGVATGAAGIVAAAGGAVVACTRKHSPGAKNFAVAAVRAGGAIMHRHGLSETVLVLPEHLGLLTGEPLEGLERRLRSAAPEKKLAIEVKTVEEGEAAARAGFDVIQTEKLPPEAVAALAGRFAELVRPPVLAASGGITEANAGAFARAGAQVLVTSAPYFSPPRDVAVIISAEK
jgi:molybdenum transport protein